MIYNKYVYNKTCYLNLTNIILYGGKVIKKWKELEHNGVMFHPEYEPHNIPIKYDGNDIYLNPEAEEFITYYVNKRFDKYRNDRFKRNFFNDWKNLLSIEHRNIIKDFNLCNFDAIKNYVEKSAEQKREERKNISKEEQEKEKKKRDTDKSPYQYAIVDGDKHVIDNYIVEPPTIFTGRGNHPLSGRIKHRLYPINITINIGANSKIPVPILPGYKQTANTNNIAKDRWGEIINDNTLEWIASWQNNVTEKYNYARFGRKSVFKMKSDQTKYDLARKLKKKIKKIREKNNANMSSDSYETRQLATALYLIDKLALRVGNEKRSNEADTVGVTTLKIKNVTILPDDMIKLDFLGKDSIRYVNKFKVPSLVHKNINDFHTYKDKSNNDDLFDMITSDTLNKYIKRFMKKLTSKVFRTYNASYLMQIELRKISLKYKDYDKPDKLQKLLHEYEMANLKVAKLCNHQKEVSKSSSTQLEKTETSMKELKSKLRKLKRDKDKKIEDGKKTTSINKRIIAIQQKIKNLKNKKSRQTESKSLSTGTSKINYIDPRITIAFLKTNNIFDNIDKFFNKSHQTQFTWALVVDSSYKF